LLEAAAAPDSLLEDRLECERLREGQATHGNAHTRNALLVFNDVAERGW
jgi:hypothetical protein